MTQDSPGQVRSEAPLSESESGGMTRREMMAVFAAGVALPAIPARRPPATVKKWETTANGPFEHYGYFKPDQLGLEATGDFEIMLVKFDESRDSDYVYLKYTFRGEESPSRRMEVTLSAYASRGKLLARKKVTLKDPRLAAKAGPVMLSVPVTPSTYDYIWLGLGTRINTLQRVVIQARERKDDS